MFVSAAGRKLQFRCQLSCSTLVDTKSAFGLGPIPYVLFVCECVRLNVWLCTCVLHCNSSGQSSRGCLFCWWLKQLAIERKDWTIGERQLCHRSLIYAPFQWSSSVPQTICTNLTLNHVIYENICWISFSAARFTHFHREPPIATAAII